MIGLLRLALVLLAIEAVFYLLVRTYLHSTRRESLEKEWDRRHPDRAGPGPARAAFVDHAMAAYRRVIRRPLFWAVLVVPLAVIMTIVFFINYY